MKEIVQIGCLHILYPSMQLQCTSENLRHRLPPVTRRLGPHKKIVRVARHRLDRQYLASSEPNHAGFWFQELYGSVRVLIPGTPMSHMVQHTFPEPLQPSVANSPSLPWWPGAPMTPSIIWTMPVPLNRCICCASSSKTCVKANRSTARLRLSFVFVGGCIVIWVGWPWLLSSTVRKRALVALEGRRRKKTLKSELEGRVGASMARGCTYVYVRVSCTGCRPEVS